VSIATVSHVIRGTKLVSPALRQRVQKAIHELDYSPNAIARGLKSQRTRMLGIILPDITNPFFPGVIRGAEDKAFESGYFLVTANTDDQSEREQRTVSALRSYRVDGILLVPLPSRKSSHVRRAMEAGIQIVFLDRPVVGIRADAVLLDNEKGSRDCVRHLVQQGHRKIAVITGPLMASNARERLLGYQKALREAGIKNDPTLVFEGDFRFDSGYRLAKTLLQRPGRATAIFACNGVMGMGAMAALDELGINCPAGMALASFDDLTFDQSAHSRLTTVVQPSYEMGSLAASLLIDRIEGRMTGAPVTVRVAPSLVIRGSTLPTKPSRR
jgi:LacI family transcriptional regulator